MKVLVTGSDGFVGRHFVQHYKSLPEFDVSEIDIKSGMDCRDFFRVSSESFDVVIHCAAVVGGREFIDNQPLFLAAEDLSIDAEMWRWAIRTKPGKIVYFSSSAAYPIELQRQDRPERNLQEWDAHIDHPDQPDATYGWVKLVGELMAEEARKAGLKVWTFRPFSGYGSDQDDAYPFPAIIKRALNRENPLEIWSDTIRDFVHIDDVVSCVLSVIESEPHHAINICTGVATPFSRLARMAANAVGYNPEIRVLSDKPTGVYRRVGNPRTMNNYYKAKISLTEGIRRAVDD